MEEKKLTDGFSYLQNNKTLKPAQARHTARSRFGYLQNNKTLKPLRRSRRRRSCFSYLQNNRAKAQTVDYVFHRKKLL